MIGDGENDVKASVAAGCRTALICTDTEENAPGSVQANLVVSSVAEFVEKVF